jgi:Lung seven transmembrane receptor
MMIEMVFIWFYYEYINLHGNNIASRVLLFIVAIMNAGRGALSFFMLLIVCMGYSIVKFIIIFYFADVGLHLGQQCGAAEFSG